MEVMQMVPWCKEVQGQRINGGGANGSIVQREVQVADKHKCCIGSGIQYPLGHNI